MLLNREISCPMTDSRVSRETTLTAIIFFFFAVLGDDLIETLRENKNRDQFGASRTGGKGLDPTTGRIHCTATLTPKLRSASEPKAQYRAPTRTLSKAKRLTSRIDARRTLHRRIKFSLHRNCASKHSRVRETLERRAVRGLKRARTPFETMLAGVHSTFVLFADNFRRSIIYAPARYSRGRPSR